MDHVTFKSLGEKGRLGNQLFQIAATVSTAIDNKMSYFFPEWEYNEFIHAPLNHKPLCPTHYYNEPTFNYNKIDLSQSLTREDVADKVYNLDGYFQSEKYFINNRELIKQLFQPNPVTANKLLDKYPVFWHPKYNLCAIHVRRGDYVDNNYYHQLDIEYYMAAVAEMKQAQNIQHFVVFSDDIEWCKQNFTFGDFTFIDGNTDYEDLILMSLCDHQITANSSFSWWGAYLNNNPDKKVIFPKTWFGKIANLNTDDLLCL